MYVCNIKTYGQINRANKMSTVTQKHSRSKYSKLEVTICSLVKKFLQVSDDELPRDGQEDVSRHGELPRQLPRYLLRLLNRFPSPKVLKKEKKYFSSQNCWNVQSALFSVPQNSLRDSRNRRRAFMSKSKIVNRHLTTDSCLQFIEAEIKA